MMRLVILSVVLAVAACELADVPTDGIINVQKDVVESSNPNAVITDLTDSVPSDRSVEARNIIAGGPISAQDRLLRVLGYSLNPEPWSQTVDLLWNGFTGARLTAIVAIENSPQGARCWVAFGGIGQTWVQLRFQTQAGRGMDFHIELYGR